MLAAYVVLTLMGQADGGLTEPSTWIYNSILIGSAAACIARGFAPTVERAPWLLLGAALGLWAGGDLYYTFFFSGAETVPFPSIADSLYLAFYPLAYVGLGLLLRRRGSRFTGSLWLDGLIGALTVAALGAAVVFYAVLDTTGGNALVVATNLAYPLFDLLMLAMLVVLVALAGWRLDRTWGLIGAGMFAFALADSAYLYQTATGTYVEGTILDVGWPLATVLIACGAWQPVRKLDEVRDEGWQALTLPTVFAFIGLSLLVYDHFHRLNVLALALASAALVAVIARAVLTFRDRVQLLDASRKEALTDALTGLGNRRKFMLDLGREVTGAEPDHSLLFVLFDLDGFKAYNDTFGHPAGDSLLSRVATRLEAAVSGHGLAYRMGGDEFCILTSAAHTSAGGFTEAAVAALTEEGEGFAVACSHGSVLMPHEAQDVSEALRIADGRMYVHKQRRRPTAGRQSMDVLLRVLTERDSELGHHLAGVAHLAEAVGRRMHLPLDQLEAVRQAAELHDVGKLAIPEEILNKPGPLTDDEWGFVKRHTLIGERILAAAPALGFAAKILRSTHERWDGAGYPDGLEGLSIPLGARIIAVCDAFDAMTSQRPYASALTREEALRELFRCAGTQFDAEIVEGFASLQSELRAQLVA